MSVFVNGSGSKILRLFHNGVEMHNGFHEGVRVFTKFSATWGTATYFNDTGAATTRIGASTTGSVIKAAIQQDFVDYIAPTGVSVDTFGVFTGTSDAEYDSGTVQVSYMLRAATGGIQVGHRVTIAGNPTESWSPTLPFDIVNGFTATTRQTAEIFSRISIIEGNGFQFRIGEINNGAPQYTGFSDWFTIS